MEEVHATVGSVCLVLCLREKLWFVLGLEGEKVGFACFGSGIGEAGFGG